jgi:hypothetical protein
LIFKAFNPSWDITNVSQGNFIDHIDLNRTNNALTNLRVASHSDNMHNTRKRDTNKCEEKCIHAYYKKNEDDWYFRIKTRVNGKTHVSLFRQGSGKIPDPCPPVPELVIRTRDYMLNRLHGEFARFD